MNWHSQSIETSVEMLRTHVDTGLSQSEVNARLAQVGPNELIEKGGRSPLKIFWEQITSTLVLILIAAAVIAGLLIAIGTGSLVLFAIELEKATRKRID